MTPLALSHLRSTQYQYRIYLIPLNQAFSVEVSFITFTCHLYFTYLNNLYGFLNEILIIISFSHGAVLNN